jgi:WD40 repeat protein
VTDFGLAKAADADNLTASGDVVGTLRYLAPERFDGPGDQRSDVYALGLTLYELLTLRPAFDAESRPKLVEQVLAAAPPAPRKVNPAVPRDLETVVLKAMAKDPARRYPAAAALAEDLRRFLDDRPVLARRASSAEQAWRWCRRNPAVASLLAAVLLVFAAGAGVSWYFAIEARAKAKEANEERDAADNQRRRASNEADQVRKERDTVRRLLYVSQINRASAALMDNRIPWLLQSLADAVPQAPEEPDLRGWEWHYLDRQARGPVLAEFTGTWSPSGRPNRRPDDLPWTPDGRVVTVREEAGGDFLEVWDTRTGRPVAQVPKAGQPPLVKPVAFTVAADGKYVATTRHEDPQKDAGQSGRRVRLWNLETGEEISGPPDVPAEGEMRVGPGAAWIVWVKGGAYAANRKQEGLTVVRWERATGEVTRTSLAAFPDPADTVPSLRQVPRGRAFAGSGGEGFFPAPDGQSVYRVLNRGIVWTKPAEDEGKEPATVHEAASHVECWDVTTSPPRPRWQPIGIGRVGPEVQKPRGGGNVVVRGGGVRSAANVGAIGTGTQLVFSRGFAAAAACNRDTVSVYRLADGKLLWQAPWGQKDQLFGVSDDGSRVAFNDAYRLTVLEKSGPADPRELVFRHAGSQGPLFLSADGKTVLTEPETNRIRVLDVARDPAQAALGKAGRLSVLRPGPWRAAERNPCVVVDADGREVARVEAPAGGRNLYARLVAGDRRLLMVILTPGDSDDDDEPGKPRRDPYEWALYDLAGPGGLKRVGGGPGWVRSSPDTRWLVVTTLTGVRKVRPQGAEWEEFLREHSVAIHDALTGDRVREVMTHRTQSSVGSVDVDPTGTRYCVMTWPAHDGEGNPHLLQGHPTLRMHETSTGRELWSMELDDVTRPHVRVFFGPDGRRVFVYMDFQGDRDRPPSTQVWVGQAADGTHELTLPLTSDRPGNIKPQVLGVTPDGRLIIEAFNVIEVWDLDTSRRTHRLPGHEGVPHWATVTADGSRLFVLTHSRLHLWDLATGRELLLVPVPWDDPALGPGTSYGVWFDGERLVVPGSKGVRVFDGSPLGP